MATTSMDYEATGERYDGKRALYFYSGDRSGRALVACSRWCRAHTNNANHCRSQMIPLATTATVVRRRAATMDTTRAVAQCLPTATTGTFGPGNGHAQRTQDHPLIPT